MDWQEAFLWRLGEGVGVLRGRVSQYLADPVGRLSAHDFLAQVAREMGEQSVWSLDAKRQLLDFLEAEYGRDGRVDELIAVWFVELLPARDEPGAEIRELLGPRLTAVDQEYTLGYVIGGAEDLFLRRMLAALPFLQAEWGEDQDRRRNDKSIRPPSPSLFMIGLATGAGHRYTAGGEAVEQLSGLFEFVESELGDPELERLIEGTFVSCLPEPKGDDDGVFGLLGPRLRRLKLEEMRLEDESVAESSVQFLYRMADAVPVLREQLQEHFREYRRPMAHAFMGQITSDMFERYASGRSVDVLPLLVFLEDEYGVDEEVDNVIAVSFLEMLPDLGERGAAIRDELGPKLRAEVEQQAQWWVDRAREEASLRAVPPADVGDGVGNR